MTEFVSSDAVQEAFLRLTKTAQGKPVDEGGILVEEFASNDASHFVGLTSVGNRALVLSTDNSSHEIDWHRSALRSAWPTVLPGMVRRRLGASR
jgi:hypothetical protein